MTPWRLEWPWPGDGPAGTAVLKSCPEDFRVTEMLDLADLVPQAVADAVTEPLSVPGDGEHLLIYLEKTGDNTPWVAGELGRLAGCGNRGVGYCGLKDRNAVTRQWFSVQRPGLENDDGAFLNTLLQTHPHWRVLAVARHHRKLRSGEHQGNRFDIRLRSVTGHPDEIQARLEAVQQHGCPNYFGLQRFGRNGANLDQALARAGKPPPRRKGRRAMDKREGLYFSAARSWLFNEVLAERVGRGDWNTTLEGEPDDRPTGPLWGDGGTRATGAQEDLERSVVARHPRMAEVFASTRMSPERRPLVLLPGDLQWQFSRSDGELVLALSFTLSPGQYATTLLSAVVTPQAPPAASTVF